MAKILKQMNLKRILKEKNGSRRLTYMLLSVFLMGFSISVFSYSGMGVDPFTALNMVMSERLGVGYGLYQMCVNGIILILIAVFSKKLINVGTIVNMIGVGYVCEFFTNIYKVILPTENHIALNILLMTLGVFGLSFSASLYFNCKVGVSPYDAVGFVMEEGIKVKYKWCRVATDLVCTGIAFLLGGPIGIGTVVTAFFMGPVIAFCDTRLSKRILNSKIRILRQFTIIRYYDFSYIQGNRVA